MQIIHKIVVVFLTVYVLMLSGCVLNSMATAPSTPTVSEPSTQVADACADIRMQVEAALENCSVLNRNKVCYGNNWLEAIQADPRFRVPADRIPFFNTNVESIVVKDDEAIAPQGIIIMYLDVGESLPVKIISLGPVEVSPTAELSSFVLRWAAEREAYVCEEITPGIMIQTPDGPETTLTINNMALTLGSTAYIAMESPERFRVTNLTGTVTVAGQPVESGNEVPVQIVNEEAQVGTEVASSLADNDMLEWLSTGADGLARVVNLNEDTQISCNRPVNEAFSSSVALPFEEQLSTLRASHSCQVLFCLNEVEYVTVRVDTLDEQFNPAVTLRDEFGRYITHNDATSNDNNNAVICNQLLPAGCYAASAHSFRHASWGAFTTSIETGLQDCSPLPFCTIGAVEGLNFRKEPSLQAEIILTLRRGDLVQDLYESSADELWKKVRVITSNLDEVGWIWANDYSLICPPVTPTPVRTPVTATPTPTPEKPPTKTNTPVPVPTRTPIPPTATKVPPVDDPFSS